MPDRVIVYVDAQNILHQARRCFHGASGHHTDGQIDPVALGQLIASRAPPGFTRVLSDVRMYTGRPDSSREPQTYGAHMRQCQAWARAGASVIPHALRYPLDWPSSRAEQKGVDVQLAIDFIAGALDDRYDVGVIFSTDTDLRPALEFVSDRFPQRPRAEAAAWRGAGANRALSARRSRRTWVHYLDAADYEAVRDRTDYRS